jgi:hypothetical protein
VPGYTPVLPGSALTFTAAERVAAGDPVELAGPMLVRHAHIRDSIYVGIAGHDAPALAPVTVHVSVVVHQGPAAGGVRWGEPLAPGPVAAPGRPPAQVMPLALAPGGLVIGVALSSAADGQDVRWMGRPLGLPAAPTLPPLPGLPGRETGGGLWFGTAGEFIPSLSPVVIYGTGHIGRPPALSSASLVIGINDRDTPFGQAAIVHLGGPLMLGIAAGGVTNGFLLVARGPGQVAAAQPADYDDPADRRVIGVALQNVSAGQRLFWVARH